MTKKHETFVYMIGMKNGEEILPYTKVGIAANVERRIAGLATSSPFAFFCHKSFSCRDRVKAMSAEAAVHHLLEDFRVRGEWFRGAPASHDEAVSSFMAQSPAARRVTRAKTTESPKVYKYELKAVENRINRPFAGYQRIIPYEDFRPWEDTSWRKDTASTATKPS